MRLTRERERTGEGAHGMGCEGDGVVSGFDGIMKGRG